MWSKAIGILILFKKFWLQSWKSQPFIFTSYYIYYSLLDINVPNCTFPSRWWYHQSGNVTVCLHLQKQFRLQYSNFTLSTTHVALKLYWKNLAKVIAHAPFQIHLLLKKKMYSLINLSQIAFFVLLQEKTLWNLLWIFLFYFNDYILQCKFYF